MPRILGYVADVVARKRRYVFAEHVQMGETATGALMPGHFVRITGGPSTASAYPIECVLRSPLVSGVKTASEAIGSEVEPGFISLFYGLNPLSSRASLHR